MPTHCAVIINPTSGGYAEEKRQTLAAALERAGFAPEFLVTGDPDDPARFARQLCAERENPLIIVCGGDGTINGVLNGLEPERATLAVAPFGTANVLARELGIHSIEEAAARIARGTSRPMAVGLLQAEKLRRYFFLMAGIGFDGSVVEGVREGEKKRFGKGAYFLAAVRRLWGWEREILEIDADGERIGCHSAVICNTRRYGGGFVLAPAADIFTPGFQVVCVRSTGRSAFFRLALAAVVGREGGGGAVRRFFCHELTVTGHKAVQVDGDFWGYTPLRVSAVAEFVRLIV
jgi:YegS/Rv2252/BmrU family lipid kinase